MVCFNASVARTNCRRSHSFYSRAVSHEHGHRLQLDYSMSLFVVVVLPMPVMVAVCVCVLVCGVTAVWLDPLAAHTICSGCSCGGWLDWLLGGFAAAGVVAGIVIAATVLTSRRWVTTHSATVGQQHVKGHGQQQPLRSCSSCTVRVWSLRWSL